MGVQAKVFPDTYVDSVVQLSATRAMYDIPGVTWAAAAMATPANLTTLASQTGPARDSAPSDSALSDPTLSAARASDLFLAVVADSEQATADALSAGEAAVFAVRAAAEVDAAPQPNSLRGALTQLPEANVAVISVPGDYATLEANKALSAGLDVLLFSDNVSVEDEIALKDRAIELGRFVMGPGAGTAMLGGVGLGFANQVRPGEVGVIAAAGTGAQEAMSLLDQFGAGVVAVIGLGGRDLSSAVGGRMAKAAIASMRADPRVKVILLVSKPPADEVARELVAAAGDTPYVAAYVGSKAEFDLPPTAQVARTLEGSVLATMQVLGGATPDVVGDLAEDIRLALSQLKPEQQLIRGLYSGGTLCYEALTILGDVLGPVWSNTPLDKAYAAESDWLTAAPQRHSAHLALDLGEEEYTVGRPHPMIDAEARLALLAQVGREPEVAAVLLDVVIGHGSHPDPAGELAPVIAEIHAAGGPRVVAYVLGTDADPQGLSAQREKLRAVGCIVTRTAGRAALAAAALATRDPALVTGPL